MPARHFTLTAVAPFRLDLTVWALRRRSDNLVDRWDGETYRRVLVVDEAPVEVAACQLRRGKTPRIEVTVHGARLTGKLQTAVTRNIERMFGLRIHLDDFYRFAAGEPKLGAVVERFRGVKPPRFPSVFEALINAIACQQVTLTLGLQLLNKVAARYSLRMTRGDELAHAFPRPAHLADADAAVLRRFGFSGQKARAMIELSRDVVAEKIDLEALADLDDAAAVERLLTLHGVGRWSAEYALLRGLGRTHIFPGDDVGARKRLQQRLKLRKSLDYHGVSRALRAWREFGGLIYFHMLLDGLVEKRTIVAEAG